MANVSNEANPFKGPTLRVWSNEDSYGNTFYVYDYDNKTATVERWYDEDGKAGGWSCVVKGDSEDVYETKRSARKAAMDYFGLPENSKAKN